MKQFLPNLHGMPLKTGDPCLVGKAHRVAFHTYPPSRRLNVIDLIHTDVCTMQKGELLVVRAVAKKKVRKKQGKRVLRKRKKGVRILIILQYRRLNNVGFGSNLTW